MQLVYRGVSYRFQTFRFKSISTIQGEYRGATWMTPVYAIAPQYAARLQYRGCQYANVRDTLWDMGGALGNLA